MSDFAKYKERDARLVILRGLYAELNHTLNETLLQTVLETFGHRVSRDYVRTQLNKLQELGAVRVIGSSTVMVAELTQGGIDHVERRSAIEGVALPSPEV